MESLLRPSSFARNTYVPACRFANSNAPSAFVFVTAATAPPFCSRLTAAPATCRYARSETSPAMVMRSVWPAKASFAHGTDRDTTTSTAGITRWQSSPQPNAIAFRNAAKPVLRINSFSHAGMFMCNPFLASALALMIWSRKLLAPRRSRTHFTPATAKCNRPGIIQFAGRRRGAGMPQAGAERCCAPRQASARRASSGARADNGPKCRPDWLGLSALLPSEFLLRSVQILGDADVEEISWAGKGGRTK